MYKLLIVDDEPTVRAGLRAYIDWSSFGIEVMDEADDGDAALEIVGRETPDLVLTDVRMPNLDGIALSREISARHPGTKIVFVSGHDDADYLKSALKVSAVDYIFKPVNLEELSAVIRRVVAELDAERAERRRKEELEVKLKEGMPLLREKLLLSLVEGGAPKQGLGERLDFLGLRLPADAPYWVAVLSVDDMAGVLASRTETDRQLLWYAVLNIAQELIDRHLAGYAFERRAGEFVGILRAEPADEYASDAAEALFAFAGDVRGNLERWLKIGVTIGISERVTSPYALAQAYGQAREAADHKWYLGKNRIITMDSLRGPETEAGGYERSGPADREGLIPALKAADPDKLRAGLDRIFADLARRRRDGLKYGRNVCLQIALAVDQLLLELNVPAGGSDADAPASGLWEALFEQETLGDLRRLLESRLLDACGRIREKRTGKTANVVERVRAIIDRGYANGGLTVAEIGREVYLTPTYVSLLFKQETGQTVNEYLTQVRVEKAKELLRDPQYKFYDICHAIGYTDPSYFTKLFKKATGVTPSAYRETHA
ncbi:response regulator [Paenibacillus sp. MWE-103]|uniref:Response regulator n=1 Tax=Paenibacillus artemisiicola TaxID=1172618 RepID=A0ABS3WEX1_9BACL|nr:response regulator [Paenibacillus artemisiicola]MBO7746818.1 response regulator [Paenibacillus artemisiicola]